MAQGFHLCLPCWCTRSATESMYNDWVADCYRGCIELSRSMRLMLCTKYHPTKSSSTVHFTTSRACLMRQSRKHIENGMGIRLNRQSHCYQDLLLFPSSLQVRRKSVTTMKTHLHGTTPAGTPKNRTSSTSCGYWGRATMAGTLTAPHDGTQKAPLRLVPESRRSRGS
jgi:hypothetical protein